MSKLQEGQVWNNRYHGRPSTIVEVFVKDEKIWVRYRVEQPYYRDEPEEIQKEIDKTGSVDPDRLERWVEEIEAYQETSDNIMAEISAFPWLITVAIISVLPMTTWATPKRQAVHSRKRTTGPSFLKRSIVNSKNNNCHSKGPPLGLGRLLLKYWGATCENP